MSGILIFLLILVPTIALCLLLRCGPEEGAPLAIFSLIALGYLLAITDLLALAGPLLWGVLLLAVAVSVIGLIRKEAFRLQLWSILPALLLFAALAMLLWWLCRGRAFVDWDDFSHWGSSIKYMYYSDELYTSLTSTDGFKSYPPATAVLEYLLLKGARMDFREDIVLYVNALLAGSLLLLPLRVLCGKKRPVESVLLTFGLLTAVLAIFPNLFYRASVDGLLGLLAGGILVAEFLPGKSRASDWVLSLGCFVLALIKTSGAGLALLAALAILAHRVAESGGFKKMSRAGWLMAALPLLAVAAAKFSWQLHLSVMGVTERWESSENILTGLWNLLTGRAPSYRYTVIRQFAEKVFCEKNYGWLFRFPFWGWILLLALAAVAARFCCAKKADGLRPGNLLWISGTALGITAVFVLSLLFSYLFFFSEEEALGLSSIYRYLDTATVLLLYCAASLLFAAVVRATARIEWAVVILFGGLLLLLCNPQQITAAVLEAPTRAAQTNHDRYLSRRAAGRISALGETIPRVYLITANDAGISQLMTEYELIPQQLQSESSILMVQAPEDQPWVKECSPEAWSRELAQGYDYVYIFCPEDQFVREYIALFEDESQIVVDRMFQVIPQQDGTSRLRCLYGWGETIDAGLDNPAQTG